MVSQGSRSNTPRNEAFSGSIDPYVLFETLTGRKIDRHSLTPKTLTEDYDDLRDLHHSRPLHDEQPSPDPRPKDLHVGVINPYAMAEAIIGYRLDRRSMAAARIMSDVLQADYEELFDMKHASVLYAGLKLNEQERLAEELSENEIKILSERDLVTPDLSRIHKLGDLEKVGLKDVGDTPIERASLHNGKIHLELRGRDLGKTVCNSEVTMTVNELALPFRKQKTDKWAPPNSSWEDMQDIVQAMMFQERRHHERVITDSNNFGLRGNYEKSLNERKFDDPIQGAMSNSWLIAAIFSVFWADPSIINRCTRISNYMDRSGRRDEKRQRLSIKFYDQGGRNNNKTDTVEVDYQVPINNSSDEPIYCRSSDNRRIWPSLYEKAFAKWIIGGSNNNSSSSGKNGESTEYIDITQTHNGDPIKAMAQINGREPHYYFTDKHSAGDLVSLVRSCSVNHRTIAPMVAFTHATGPAHTYCGSNLVANHAYSVLGWVSSGQNDRRQHIVVRNPFGVTEPSGFTSYPGLVDRVEPEFWNPASLLDRDGVLAFEAETFKECFACIGVAK